MSQRVTFFIKVIFFVDFATAVSVKQLLEERSIFLEN